MSDRRLAIGPDTLDVAEVIRLASGADPGAHGAVVTFVGTVRGDNQGRRVIRLEYEAYEPLALRAFAISSRSLSSKGDGGSDDRSPADGFRLPNSCL